jgi:hypothetical protein
LPPAVCSLSRRLTCLALLALLALAAAGAHAATGRIAVAGAWGTGYVGLLARHGMPRERLLDPQLTDPAVLRRYDLVIVSGPVRNWDAVQPVIEQYVRDGGAAWLEHSAMPSADALPGQRIAPQAGPNFVLEAANHPALAGLPAGKTYPHNGESAAAIVPDPASGAVVLARFTEQGASAKVRGKFVLNGQSVPAIVYRQLGKGQLLYSGAWIGYALAFGVDDSDLCFALLRFLTGGNVVPRLTLAGPEDLLIARPWAPALPQTEPPAQRPTLPEGFTLVENPGPTFQEYDLSGKVAGAVDVLLDYAAADHCYRLHLADAKVPGIDMLGQPISSGAPAVHMPPGSELIVARRHGAISVLLNRRTVLRIADRGQWAGAVACQGLTDPAVQPVEPVSFADDFMQEAGEAAAWHVAAGKWQIVSTEGEPRTGANPFSYGVQTNDVALATAGESFWDDYSFEASARWTQNAVGLVFDYGDASNYDVVEADLASQAVRLVTVRDGKRSESEPLPAALRPWQWYRLGVRASRNTVCVLLDGKVLKEYQARDDSLGPVGLYARNTKAAFDDVEVTDWRGGPSWRDRDDWLTVEGSPWVAEGNRVVTRGTARTAEQWADVAVTAELRLADAQQAGVRVRDTGAEACAAAIERTSGGLVLRLLQMGKGANPTVLGSVPLNGRKPTDLLRLTVKAVRERVFCAVEGGPYVLRATSLPGEGAVAVFASGKGGAQFESVDIRPADSDLHPADPATPAYAGAVDVMTWAGPAFSWLPDPRDLDLFWHEGEVPGPLRLRVGVHRGEAKEADAEVLLADTEAANAGYTARFTHAWGGPEVSVALQRGADTLARGAYNGPIPDAGYLAEVECSGPTVALRVNGQPVVLYNDPEGGPDCRRVGVKLQGATLCYDDLLLERANVRTYTFSEAPVDWLVQRGTWEVTSRWTCSPGWTWLSGLDPRHAMIQSKWQVEGDVFLDVYVGPKMMQTPQGRKEELQDIRLGVCGRPGYLNAGYFLLIGAKGGAWTALQRDGLVVAEAPNFVIPRSSAHNDWLRLSVSKRGNEIALLCQGQPVLTYTDPDPLLGGTVSLGTYDNGLMFPRVTVCGEFR